MGPHLPAATAGRLRGGQGLRPGRAKRGGGGGAVARPTIGLDLGGTKTLAVVATVEGGILGQSRMPTPHGGRAELVEALCAAVAAAAADAGIAVRDAAGVGVGVPGPTDPRAGVLLDPPNLPADCRDLPLGAILGARLGLSVSVENDANAAAVGELRFGAGRGAADMIYITMSTGIGAGIVADGRLVRGSGLTAGEIGHMLLAPEGGDICGCGRIGCWEAVCSGTGIARQAREAVEAGRAPGMAAAAAAGALTPAAVLEAASRGDPAAQGIIGRVARYNGYGLLNLLHLLSPGRIVIGGGLTHGWDQFLEPAARWARAHAMARPAEACTIVPAALGDVVGGLGAAALVATD